LSASILVLGKNYQGYPPAPVRGKSLKPICASYKPATSKMNDYYVYVYIDPRNFEEFYYGKGRDNRKGAHLQDSGDSEKARRIQAIHKAG